jgi:SAM-dependent methyltransferase
VTDLTGDANFYDRVAARFGEYRTGARHTSEYPGANPEAVFESLVVAAGAPEKVALDAGSGDGRFTLRMAAHYRQIVGIEVSAGMRAVAERRRREQGVTNVRFEPQDAGATTFPDASFDVVYSRRGPMKYREFARLLRPSGTSLLVGIGEKDALDLKRAFGRGQGFEQLQESWLGRSRSALVSAGLTVTDAEDFAYDEYFPTYEDLETFLLGVPIFEDFDPVADRDHLQAYIASATGPKGIVLQRHRFVASARKAG